LGLAGVRPVTAGRYREAADTLEANLNSQVDWALTYDLYFLAMCQHKLGDPAKARQYYDLAERWANAHRDALAPYAGELKAFQDEAVEVLGIGKKKD
jgi:hypothetical protein